MSGYVCTNSLLEQHKKPLYCVSFNFVDLRNANVFAAVGSNKVSVYRCKPKGVIELQHVYVDEDKDELFYVCKWTVDEDTESLVLLVAGLNGVVRVLDVTRDCVVHTFVGHGNSINDIIVHPSRPQLFITASKDESLRLWNLKTKLCVMIVSGECAHTNEVLSIDFHPYDNNQFVSAGMDNCIKIWSLQGHSELIKRSNAEGPGKNGTFTAQFLSYPIFSSQQIHGNYVDCVRWVGNYIVSKSVDDKILLWKPQELDPTAPTIGRSFTLLQEFRLYDCSMWWLRFSLDFHCTLLACGNINGRVYLYDPLSTDSTPVAKLQTPACKSAVRQTAVSFNGKTIIACCEDGSVWRWDKVVPSKEKEAGPDKGSVREKDGSR